MARKVKCRYCGEQIDVNTAFAVKHGKSNWYYCNEEHSNLKLPRDELYEQLNAIFGKIVTHTVLYKEFDYLGSIYGYELMLAYIKQEYQYLCMVMSRDFSNDYNRIRYLSAIFKNHLGDFEVPKEEIKEIKKEVEVEFYENKVKPKKEKRGLESVLEDLLNE